MARPGCVPVTSCIVLEPPLPAANVAGVPSSTAMVTAPPLGTSVVRLVTVYARPARTRSGRVADTVIVCAAGVAPGHVMGTATLTSVLPGGPASAAGP